jgi:hypothetical protein
MYRSNPMGRIPRSSQVGHPIRVGEGAQVHMSHPDTGLPLCMPSRNAQAEGRTKPQKGNTTAARCTRTRGEQVTCMRCMKLMAINHTLRGDDLSLGDAAPLVSAARASGRR